MTAIHLHPAPTVGALAREQFRAITLLLRPFLIAIGTIAIVVDAWMLLTAKHWGDLAARGLPQSQVLLAFDVQDTLIAALLACLFAVIPWAEEDPGRRSYHWAMPLDRTRHAMLKLGAAWIWLVVSCAAFIVNLEALDVATKVLQNLPLDTVLRGASSSPWWHYAVVFTGATLAFLLFSAAALGSRRPLVWIVGLPLVLFGVALATKEFGPKGVERLLRHLGTADYGFFVNFGFGLGDARSVRGQQVADGMVQWLGASAIWFPLALFLVVYTARRRPEVR